MGMISADHPLGLSLPVIEALRQAFSHYPAVEKVLVFGSRARGKHEPGSDIDLAVFGPDLSESDFSRLWGDLDELPIAFKMDVLHFDTLHNQALRDRILRDGKAIYPETRL